MKEVVLIRSREVLRSSSADRMGEIKRQTERTNGALLETKESQEEEIRTTMAEVPSYQLTDDPHDNS